MNFFDLDISKLQTITDQRDAAANDPTINADLSGRLADFHTRYPWMDPEAKWSLAAAGVDPGSPEGQVAGMGGAILKGRTGLGFDSLGSPATAGNGPVDLSGMAQRVDAAGQRVNQSNIGLGGTALGRPASAMREIATDDAWFNLPVDVRQQLDQVTLAPTGDQGQYTVGGVDQLSPDAQTALYKILQRPDRNARTSLSGPFAKGELSINGDNMLQFSLDHAASDQERQQILADARYQGPNTVTFNAGPAPDMGPVMGGTNILATGIPQIAPPLRAASMVLSAPLQELQGQIRNVYELATQHDNPNWLQSQSDLGIATGDLLSGRKVDVGDGILVDPRSQVVQERQRRELQRGTVGGEAFTLGRGLATAVGSVPGLSVVEPGSKPYQLLSGLTDAAAAVALDPTAWALRQGQVFREADGLFASPGSVGQAFDEWRNTGSITDALQAFHDAGGLSGFHPQVSRAANEQWLTGQDGQAVARTIAQTDNTYAIIKGLGGKIDPAVAARMADTSDTAVITDLLRGELGTTVTQKPSVAGLTSTGRLPLTRPDPDAAVLTPDVPSKWAPSTMMPGRMVDPNNLTANVVQLERIAALTKSTIGDLSGWVDQMARTTTPFERMGVYEQAMHDVANRMVDGGISPAASQELTRMWQESQAVDRLYAIQTIGDGRGLSDTQLVNDGTPLTTTNNQPTMLAQTLDSGIPQPDWQEVRRALAPKPWQWIMSHEAPQAFENGLGWLENRVWKGLQILTNKTMFKVLGDEQAASAARGYVSIGNHPIQAAAMILATPLAELPEDAAFAARLKNAASGLVRDTVSLGGRIEPTVTADVLGHDFSKMEEIRQIASHGYDAAVDDRGLIFANDWRPLWYKPGVNDDEFAQAYARHFAQYAASPEMRGFASADTLQDAKDWYWNGEGQRWRELMAKNGRTGIPELLNRPGADAWVEQRINQMSTVTNGHPDLVAAVRDGELNGTPIWDYARDGSPRVSKQFVSELQANHTDDFPQVVPQQKAIYSADLARRQVGNAMFDRLIRSLLSTPSAVLSKSPLFRQAYWEKIADTAPFMTADAQNEALRVAQEEANLPAAMLDDLQSSITNSNRLSTPFAGTLDLDTADQLARAHGLDIVRRTTHEFSERSQLFDQLKLLTPFGEVWRKTIKRWANIINENPQTIRRAQQGYEALRSPGLGQFMGAPTVMQNGHPVQQGFFHQDGNGNEVFTVPFSEMATQALTGAPVPLVGNVKGLSLGTEFFPALGPVAQFPVAWTLDKLNLMDQNLGPLGKLGDLLFPYGAPRVDVGSVADGWNYAPSWMKNAFGQDRPTSPDSVRTFNNSVIAYLRLGLSQGDYDFSTPDKLNDAIGDATNKAHELYAIRGAAQFFIPGAPAPQMLLADKSGKLTDAAALIQEYRDMENGTSKTHPEANANNAAQIFLGLYGTNLFRAMTPMTYSYVFNLPTSPDAQKWVDDNPKVKDNLPNLYGYFAPPSDPKQFDYNVYRNQLDPGGPRTELSPLQWANLTNARLAAKQYGFARQRVIDQNGGKNPDAGQRAWLTGVRQQLIDKYPGYSDLLSGGTGLPSRPDPTKLAQYVVPEARKALSIPAAASSEAGQGLKAFLGFYDQATSLWRQSGRTTDVGWLQSTSPDGLALRDWVRQKADRLVAQYPRFGPLFDDVFDRAMKLDTDPTAPPGG